MVDAAELAELFAYYVVIEERTDTSPDSLDPAKAEEGLKNMFGEA